MSYTPINWQTGDTITAEKMNKMDNGWGIENTQLFSETVTTADEGGFVGAQLTYSTPINAETIEVIFDGTAYTCTKIAMGNSSAYGGVGESGPDYTDYPFALVSAGNVTYIYTESAGTYSVSAFSDTVETSDNFARAVKSASQEVFIATENVTTWQEIYDALASGKIVHIDKTSHPNYVISEPVYSAKYNDGVYEVSVLYIEGGAASAKYYNAASADSPIFPN